MDDRLLAQVRRRAAEAGRTVSQVVEDAVRESLLRTERRPAKEFRITPVSTGGYQPGVDISDNAALLDLMESRES